MSTQSLRGESVDVAGVDEGFFCPESVMREFLLPVMSVEGRTMLVISTHNPKGERSVLKQFVCPPGEGGGRDAAMRMMDAVNITLVCDACLKRDPNIKRACVHRAYLLPRWKSADVGDTIGSALSTRLAQTELLGLSIPDDTYCFRKQDIAEACTQNVLHDVQLPTTGTRSSIYVIIDPAGAGPSSFFAVAAGAVLPDGKLCVLGGMRVRVADAMEKVGLVAQLCNALIERHIRAFAAGNCSMMICPESCSTDASYYMSLLPMTITRMRECVMWYRGKKQTGYGFVTNNMFKRDITIAMQRLLNEKPPRLCFDSNAVHVTAPDTPEAMCAPVQNLTAWSEEEMPNWRCVQKSSDPFRERPAWTFNGKQGGRPDDWCLCLCFLAHFAYSQEFLEGMVRVSDMETSSTLVTIAEGIVSGGRRL